MSEFSDDEAISLAMLVGCTFWKNEEGIWYMVDDNDEKLHPLEAAKLDVWKEWQEGGDRPPDWWGWPDRASLARDYLNWFRSQKRDAA